MVMVYITQYGILILYRHKGIFMLRCSKWQKHPQNIIKKSVLLLPREDVLLGPKLQTSLHSRNQPSSFLDSFTWYTRGTSVLGR